MGDAVVCADGRLDDELVAVLEPKLQDALNQPTRREILRVLHGKERACGVAEVLHQLHPLTRAEVSYHVQVLKEAAAVVADGSRPGLHGRDEVFRSALSEDPGVLAVLAVTRQSDRRRRQGKGNKSSGLLKMFRIPHPERAISLSMRRGRKAKPAK